MMMQSFLDPFIALLASLRSFAATVLPADWIGALPALVLVVFAFLALATSLKFNPLPVSIVGVVVAAIAATVADPTLYPLGSFGALFVRDSFGDFFIMIVLVVGFLVLLSASQFSGERGPYNFLLLLSFAGGILVVMANDLVAIFIAWELLSTPTYILVAIGPTRGAVDGATKYFVLGLLASMLMLFGMALLYAATGATSLATIGGEVGYVLNTPEFEPVTYTYLLSMILFIISFGFKIGIFPGWMWVADAYGNADGSVAAYLAGSTKKTGIGALVRILMVAFIMAQLDWLGEAIGVVIAIVSVLTMVVGNFLALSQKNMMRMLAYSSIAMMGYLFMGVAATAAAQTEYGVATALFQAFAHAIMKSAAFIVIWAITLKLSKQITYDDLSGLSQRSPFAAASLSILMLALAGAPPTVGFLSKLFLFLAAFDAGLLWLVVIGLLNSVYSLGYYLRVVKYCYFTEPKDTTRIQLSRGPTIAVAISVIAVFLFFIAFGPIFDWAFAAAASLMS